MVFFSGGFILEHYIMCLEKQTLLICYQDTNACFLGDGLAISLISTSSACIRRDRLLLKLQEVKMDGGYCGRKTMYLPAAQAILALLPDNGRLPSVCLPQWGLGHSGKQSAADWDYT